MGLSPFARTDFLFEGGSTGALMAALGQTNSPLGAPENWSSTLRTTVGLALRAEAQIVLFWGPEFVALYNDAYAPTIGDKHPQAMGRPARENWAELWHDLGPLLEGVRNTGRTFVAKDRPFYIERRGFGEMVFFDVSYSAVPDDDGSVAGVLCIVCETTERVRAEAALRQSEARLRELNETLERRVEERTEKLDQANAALRQAQKMEAVGQLTGGIAHDFNNLLQGIAGNLDLIRHRPEDPAKVLRWAKAGLKAAERGARLASQLLAFSRTQKLELKSFDVTKTVAGFSDMLQRSIGPTIQIEMYLETASINVVGDPVQLELAVLNLALNARDAMPKGGGRLTVSSRLLNIVNDVALPSGEYVELSLTDNGSGMPPETVERAFEPFFTTKEVGKGTGLGLSQVYGAITQAGGTVRIESTVGAGTTVRLYLHRADAPSIEVPEQPVWRMGNNSAGRVLVVDDDPDVRSFLFESLAGLGYVSIMKEDGLEALAEMERLKPDVMIVDFAMPGINGAEVARRARAIHPKLPIIFASGYAETAAVHEVIDQNSSLLQKPFRIEDLQFTLRRLLAEPTN
jgi:signal transduction histidine kinase/CheY-like chemotaxis protein